MTPHEKAVELVDYFMNFNPVKLSDYSKIYLPTAKKFALKVCDEVLDKDGYNNDYWQEVKQEIEKL
jgi:hypothetical protein